MAVGEGVGVCQARERGGEAGIGEGAADDRRGVVGVAGGGEGGTIEAVEQIGVEVGNDEG